MSTPRSDALAWAARDLEGKRAEFERLAAECEAAVVEAQRRGVEYRAMEDAYAHLLGQVGAAQAQLCEHGLVTDADDDDGCPECDFCYTCERITRWREESCTGCGRVWGEAEPATVAGSGWLTWSGYQPYAGQTVHRIVGDRATNGRPWREVWPNLTDAEAIDLARELWSSGNNDVLSLSRVAVPADYPATRVTYTQILALHEGSGS